MPYEVSSAVTRTILQLREKEEEVGTDAEFLDSYVTRYHVSNEGVAKGRFVKAGDMKKKEHNREYVTIEFQINPFNWEECLEKVRKIKKKVIPLPVITTLKARFTSYDDVFFSQMKWFNPEYWTSDKDFGIADIEALASHFKEPLSLASFEIARALKEWRNFKIFGKTPDAKSLWKSILTYRRDEFPHLCKLASLIVGISGSNSAVERTFSVVTNVLADKRLLMHHDTLKDALVVYGNDRLWSREERDEIIDRAIQIYLQKKRRRNKKLTCPPAKRQRINKDETSGISTLVAAESSGDENSCNSEDEFSQNSSDSECE